MNALLLAAGLGTRLRPITDTLTKCLIPIQGKPLLGWWMDLLEQHGVRRVLVNIHHLPNQVRAFAEAYRGSVEISLVHEEHLLGSAGTICANQDFFRDQEQFFILYADNLTDVNLTALKNFNQQNPAPLTVGLFRPENPRACGIAELDTEGTIIGFEEKPKNPRGELASAGVFVGRPELLDYLQPALPAPFDFGGHVMPRLIGRMNGVEISGYLRDIGTHESLQQAEKEWGRVGSGG
ncbi:MAG: nucleotidyltransferase family protein [Armatimonadetes bacterium]|nr:nucleotidyltransferase family protein [Armatimonadota bacterium]